MGKKLIWSVFAGILTVGCLAIAQPARAFDFDLGHWLGSIGFYSNGCLDGDAKLSDSEIGLQKLFPERERRYGNPAMIELLVSAGRAYEQEWLREPGSSYEPIHLGDIAQKGGGQISRHASHQTGLDVDVVYMRNDHRVTPARRGAEASFDEIFVHNGLVTRNLDAQRTWWFWRFAYRHGSVDRIFVDPAIKKFFCRAAAVLEPSDSQLRTEVLRLLRPYPNHDDHFHMRLRCPAGETRCVGGPALPAGSGCAAHEMILPMDEMVGPDDEIAEPVTAPVPARETPVKASRLPRECVELRKK